jgi:hypothetical protein
MPPLCAFFQATFASPLQAAIFVHPFGGLTRVLQDIPSICRKLHVGELLRTAKNWQTEAKWWQEGYSA